MQKLNENNERAVQSKLLLFLNATVSGSVGFLMFFSVLACSQILSGFSTSKIHFHVQDYMICLLGFVLLFLKKILEELPNKNP